MHELRIYELGPGGEEQILRRLTEFMPSLFARHGLRPVAQWMAVEGPAASSFVWMLHWPDWNSRAQAFSSLYADPGFATAIAATQPDGPWLERFHVIFLSPSLAHPGEAGLHDNGVDELVLEEVRPGTASAVARAMRDDGWPVMREQGATPLGHFDVVSGWPLQSFARLIRWPAVGQGAMRQSPVEGIVRSTRWPLRPLPHCTAQPGLGQAVG